MNTYAYDEKRLPRWLLVAGAVVAIAALLAVGFITGRGTAPAGGGSATRVVNAQGGPGPTRVVNGVPVGYAHTQAGAVAAATNYLMVTGGPLLLATDKYLSAIATMSAPEAASKLRQNAEGDLTAQQSLISYAAQGRSVVRRAVPLAYHVGSYNGASVTVSIWSESLIAVDGVVSLREGWTTTTLTCEWAVGDWKLSAIAAPGPESFGPVPTPIEAPGQSVTLPPQLANYRSYAVDVPT